MLEVSEASSRWSAVFTLALGGVALMIGAQTRAGVLETGTQAPFGTFRGVEFVRYTGRFSGETSLGPFRVPYEIVAPAEPKRGNRTVIIEPPHFLFGMEGRDATLGHGFLFRRGFSHASVGFSENNFNMLDPSAVDALIAGEPAIVNSLPITRDVEIIKQFSEVLTTDPYALEILGDIERRYGYGVSQTSEVWFDVFYNTDAEGLLDLTVMNLPLWRPPFAEPSVLDALPEDFTPLVGIGKVMFVNTEGDLLISDSLELRKAVIGPTGLPGYRMYEVAGAPHVPQDVQLPPDIQLNPLDHASLVRAIFLAGNRWVRLGFPPPESRLLQMAQPGEIDSVYGFETGIARDGDGNASGGVRFPDLAIGRALFVASSPIPIPGLPPGLVGEWFDLACAPRPGSQNDRPRFCSHGAYVFAVARQALHLLFDGYLLVGDAVDLIRDAVHSDVGKSGFCDSAM